MSRTHFSIAKLHKYQKQRQRLAEMEAARCKAELDRSVQRLNDLYVRFDQVTDASHQDLSGGARLAHAHQDVLKHLRHEIDSAREGVDQKMANWHHKVAASTAERIKAESYELLEHEQQAARTVAAEKAELNDLSEIIMRQWSRPEGE